MKHNPEKVEFLEQMANRLRRHVLTMIGVGKSGHLGGSNSLAEVIAALYFDAMDYRPPEPHWKDRDRLVLSKGHAALIQYAALCELGLIPADELKYTKSLGSMLQGHPDMRKTPGIEAGTGSLGQGLSIACGMALGLRLDKSKARVYAIIGDGELAEGQIWEAAMSAKVYRLSNLTAILDKNDIQATGRISERFDVSPIREKWEAFGWSVFEADGHNIGSILSALDSAKACIDKPSIVIANTIKGKGVSFAEDSAAFHNAVLTEDQYESACTELARKVQL